MPEKLFTYFGNKQRIAKLVWQLFGTDNRAYAEPFCGSASILLHSPVKHSFEVINDADCYVANAHRAIKYYPEEVASHLYNPRCEIDLWSRHDYLINHKKDFTQVMLREDPTFCDPELAAWWIWGQNLWIGSNYCSPDCLLTKCKPVAHNQGVLSWSQKPTNVNKGVLSTKSQVTWSQKPSHRNVGVLSLTNEEQSHAQKLFDRVHSVFERLIDTTILCGNWTRALTHSYTTSYGKCAIFLDPPYPGDYSIYENESLEGKLFRDVIDYFLKNYKNPDMRIILCGQDSFWPDCPEDVHKIYWKRSAGYAKDKSNRDEVLWCSDACLFGNVK
jgi:site-specific DNA-adenine methylase